MPLSRSANRELKYRGGEELEKRVIRKSGNGSSKALYLNKKVEVNLIHLPARSQQESFGLLRELTGTSPGHNWENLHSGNCLFPSPMCRCRSTKRSGVPLFAWDKMFNSRCWPNSSLHDPRRGGAQLFLSSKSVEATSGLSF